MPSIDKLTESGFWKRSTDGPRTVHVIESMLSYFYRYTLRVDTYFFENVEKIIAKYVWKRPQEV